MGTKDSKSTPTPKDKTLATSTTPNPDDTKAHPNAHVAGHGEKG